MHLAWSAPRVTRSLRAIAAAAVVIASTFALAGGAEAMPDFATIYGFQNASDSAQPVAALAVDAAGNLSMQPRRGPPASRSVPASATFAVRLSN